MTDFVRPGQSDAEQAQIRKDIEECNRTGDPFVGVTYEDHTLQIAIVCNRPVIRLTSDEARVLGQCLIDVAEKQEQMRAAN